MPEIPDTFSAFVYDTEPVIISDHPSVGVRLIRTMTFYNPNATAVDFKVNRCVVTSSKGDEIEITLYDDQIPATDYWPFGSLGGVLIVRENSRLEIVLDSTPTLPIHVDINFLEAT